MTAVATEIAGNPVIPEAKGHNPVSPEDEIEAAVAALAKNKAAWAAVDLPGRIALLDRILKDTVAAADAWAAAAIPARRLPKSGPVSGEEYLLGPWPTVRCARLYRETLAELHHTGTLQPGKTRSVGSGQVAARVFPASIYDTMLFFGTTAEIWMEPGVTASNLADTMGQTYRGKAPETQVSLVLGAGNVTAISSTDVLHKLLVENHVVVLKMNPVNDYAGRFIAKAFAALIDGGFLRIVYGGVAEGARLTEHDEVTDIHLTGSDKTHDAIVFGPGEQGRKNKLARTIINDREFSSELPNEFPSSVVAEQADTTSSTPTCRQARMAG